MNFAFTTRRIFLLSLLQRKYGSTCYILSSFIRLFATLFLVLVYVLSPLPMGPIQNRGCRQSDFIGACHYITLLR